MYIPAGLLARIRTNLATNAEDGQSVRLVPPSGTSLRHHPSPDQPRTSRQQEITTMSISASDATANDDGQRVSLDELRADLNA